MSSNFALLKYTLREFFNSALPGHKAHTKMAPMLGSQLYRTFTPTSTATRSAVLILLVGCRLSSLSIFLTLRSSNLILHRNQISFPGGHCEPNEKIIDTAIRECFEETGIIITTDDVVGNLSELFVPPSDTIISPVVALVETLPSKKINEKEVAEIFTVPISFFMNEDNIQKEIWEIKGRSVEVPLWKVHPKVPLWGATAMILAELIEVLKPLYKKFY